MRHRTFTDEERKQRKNDYMLHKEWFCEICNNNKNYTLAGKTCHLRTKKHYKDEFEYKNPGEEFISVEPWHWRLQDERFGKD